MRATRPGSPGEGAWISVSVIPGATALTRTGRGRPGEADGRGLDRPLRGRIPDELVGRAQAGGRIEERLTIVRFFAPSVGEQRASGSRATRVAPVTLTSMQVRMTCGSASASLLPGPVMPALLTTWLNGPSADFASAKTLTISASLAMSPLSGDGLGASRLAGRRPPSPRRALALIVHGDIVAALGGHDADRGADAAAAAGDEENGTRLGFSGGTCSPGPRRSLARSEGGSRALEHL